MTETVYLIHDRNLKCSLALSKVSILFRTYCTKNRLHFAGDWALKTGFISSFWFLFWYCFACEFAWCCRLSLSATPPCSVGNLSHTTVRRFTLTSTETLKFPFLEAIAFSPVQINLCCGALKWGKNVQAQQCLLCC